MTVTDTPADNQLVFQGEKREYSNDLYRFNLLCIYIFILWKNFSLLEIVPDARGRIITLFVILCFLVNCFANSAWRRILMSKPVVIWAIWCVYTSINSYFQGHLYTSDTFENLVLPDVFYPQTIFMPLFMMTTVCWLYLNDKKRLILNGIAIFAIAAVATLLFDSISEDWGGGSRFGDKLGNAGALQMVAFVFLLAVAWLKKYLSPKFIIAGLFLALYVVLAIQTRKALSAIGLIIIFAGLTKIKFKKVTSWIFLAIGILAIYYLAGYILDNTEIGERFTNVEEEGSEVNLTGIPILSLLGDRALHVYLGWFIWLDHPIVGVGLRNAPAYSLLPYVFHNEYITQLAENGIIGFTLLITFWTIMCKRIIRKLRSKLDAMDKNMAKICLGGFLAIVFIGFTAWLYEFTQYFIMYGIICAVGYSSEQINNIFDEGNSES